MFKISLLELLLEQFGLAVMEQLKFIWPAALIVVGVFVVVIGIATGLIDPEALMI